MTKYASIQRGRNGSTKINQQINLLYKQTERKRPHGYLIRCRTDLWKNSALLHYKKPGEIRDKKNIVQHDTGIYTIDTSHTHNLIKYTFLS